MYVALKKIYVTGEFGPEWEGEGFPEEVVQMLTVGRLSKKARRKASADGTFMWLKQKVGV